MKIVQFKMDDLHDWFFKIAQKMNQPTEDSPYVSPKKRELESPVKSRPFFSPEPSPTYKGSFAQSNSIYGFKEHNTDNTSFNASSIKEVPTDWLLKFVLLCAEVESLRKKVGDKQAKMESMRTSIASKTNQSNATIINGLASSRSST